MYKKSLLINILLLAVIIGGCAAPGDQAGKRSGQSGDQGVDPNYDASKQKAVKLTQTARGAQVTVDARVLFETGKADLKNDGLVLVDRVATMLKEKTKATALIEGHTDSTGTAQLNQRLSEQRADSVRAGLVARGVPVARIQTKGLGPTQPVADNATEGGRTQNRRVEIIMLGEDVERIGGQAQEERLASGLEKFLKNAGEFIQGVFGRITGGGDNKPE